MQVPGQAEKLYEAGYEFSVPLHRLMSKDDVYGTLLGAKGVGPLGLVYRCALREIEGAYAEGAKPSQIGLPPYKGAKPKKRKADDAEDNPPAAYTRAAVSAAECKEMVRRLEGFASAKAIPLGEVWMHQGAASFEMIGTEAEAAAAAAEVEQPSPAAP